jgi:hypothetical protein
VQSFEHGEIIGPLGTQLGFELGLRNDALSDQQLRQGVGHRQAAHHQLFEANFLRFIFFAHRLLQQLSQLDAKFQTALRQQTPELDFCAT